MSNDFDLISDLHKDARGFRPTGEWLEHFDALPAAEQQRVWDGLCEELDAEQEEERRRQNIAIARFNERVAAIRATVIGATVHDAIRFLHDAHDTRGDDGYLEYSLGLPYGHLRQF